MLEFELQSFTFCSTVSVCSLVDACYMWGKLGVLRDGGQFQTHIITSKNSRRGIGEEIFKRNVLEGLVNLRDIPTHLSLLPRRVLYLHFGPVT